MKKTLLPLLVVALSACGAVKSFQKATSDMVGGVMGGEPIDTSGYSYKSVGESESVPASLARQKNSIEKIINQYRKPGFKQTSGLKVAWNASREKMNGHVLYSGSKALLIARVYAYGKYFEIIYYDPKPDHSDNIPWIDKAEDSYKRRAKGQPNRLAVNGNYLMFFEKADAGNANYIKIFEKARL
jgi:hypothetical protein